MPVHRRCSFILALTCVTGIAHAHDLRLTQEYGFTFSEIGDVGNPGFAWDAPGPTPEVRVGGVDHRYRISTTEVTNAQWLTFVQTLSPHIEALGISPNASEMIGFGIRYLGRGPDGEYGYRVLPQNRQLPVEIGWRFAARYCNWLNNGAPTGSDVPLSVFETGAYDASTFTTNPDGTRNDQIAHNPDAKFWIPTRDEWHKAGYWDPNRYGEGEGGYWLYPNGTDERLEFGLPGAGGETNFGMNDDGGAGVPRDVGSYPDVTSPWGLLDVSGGAKEWNDDVAYEPFRERFLAGTRLFTDENEWTYGDHLGWNFLQFSSPIFANGGLRIAAAIPSPGVFPALLGGAGLLVVPRRRA